MSRDRRRGKRRYQNPLPSRPEPSQRAPAPARTMPRPGAPSKQPLLGNPHLGQDLRGIGIVTAVLVVLLIVLWLVL